MTSRARHPDTPLSSSTRRALLRAGTALCGVAALALTAGAAGAVSLPTQLSVNLATAGAGSVNTKVLSGGAVTPATANYVSTGATATVTLAAPRTLIDWTTFHVDAGSTLNFTFTNTAGDIVLNRVMGGAAGTNTIAIDAGGAVHGTFNGAVGGNIWFLAPDGVFINGTVTASGVLATSNTAVADLNLLSDAAATLKGELAAGGSLIDLSGITAATGATIDASGNLFLSGPETATGDVMLESTGTLAINAPIVAEGAVPVTLAYNTNASTNLSFGAGGAVTFANADGSAATASAGGSLTVNGTSYTLLYKLAEPGSTGPDTGIDDVAGIDNNAKAGGDNGFYALATNLAGTGTAANPQFTSALAGQGPSSFNGAFEGLGHTITGLTINDPASGTVNGVFENVGLFGFSGGTVRDLGLVGGSIAGANLADVGALVGTDLGEIVHVYATSMVSGGQDGAVGGLVGAVEVGDSPGRITQAYATGAVTGAGLSATGAQADVGGLVGANAGVITQAYAMGAVSGGAGTALGGLVGTNSGAIAQTYATGAVSPGGVGPAGGLVGLNTGPTTGPGGTIASSAFDTLTTGQFFGIGQDGNNQQANIVSLATSDLQTLGLPSGFDPAVWGGGSAGLYPFLASFFPNGVQAVADFAFAGFDRASLASNATQAVTIGVIAGGTKIGEATTGANGYYYVAAPAGTLTDGETLLTFTAAGAPGSANLSTASSAAVQSKSFLYSGVLIVSTAAVTLSAAPTLAQAQAQAVAAAGGNTEAQSSINSTTGLGLQATGNSFTIDQPVAASAFGVLTQAGAPLTVAASIVLAPGGELGLFSGGALAINAPITVNGIGGAFFAYDPTSPRNLSFGNGGSLTYNTATGGPATSSQGGVLGINGQIYTLLYNLALAGSAGPDAGVDDIAGIDANANAGGDSGFYALATNLTGTGTAASPQFTGSLAGVGTNLFAGVFEGLGHTLTNLTIADPTSGSLDVYRTVGLFGLNAGLLRDISLVGGFASGADYTNVGGLAGYNTGAIVGAAANGAMNGGLNARVGGLVGYNSQLIAQSFAAGAVTGGQLSKIGGLVGYNFQGGVITQSHASGPVGSAAVNVAAGGLVGANLSTIAQSYATGDVSGGQNASVGGLAGYNLTGSTVILSYATGAVSGGSGGVVGGLLGYNNGVVTLAYASGAATGGAMASVGGLVGENDAEGAITQAYATGPASGAYRTGGLVGYNRGSITEAYATGAVSGAAGAILGGLVGYNDTTGTIAAGDFDVLTTGQAAGIGQDTNSQSVAALTTSQLQTGGLPLGFSAGAWGGGDGGLYPYLTAFFPTGVQAVSGVAYSDAGMTPVPSGLAGPVIVQLLAGGVPVGTAATGANGYYYIVAPSGTFSGGEPLQASIISGGPAESGFFTPSTTFVAQPGVNIYGSGGPLVILPVQGTTNLAVVTTGGTLTASTLAGGVVTSGAVDYVSTGSAATVTLTAARTLIDWTSFEVGNGATLNFDFTGGAGDIVLNRLATGTIAIDAGGAVNGLYAGKTGGNIWFLAPGGVLIDGAVTAGGVLASNNTGVADLSLLSDASATLKGELAAGGSLMDFDDATSVTGAAIDGSGGILLTGAIDTGPAGTVELVSSGTVTQTGGGIATGTLSGSSVGGAAFQGTNQIAGIGAFTNAGGGGFTLTDGAPLTVVAGATLDAGAASLTLVDSSNGVATGAGSLLKAGQDITLVSGGAASIGGPLTAGRNIDIAAATFSDPQGALTAPGTLALTLNDPAGVVLTASPSAGPGSSIVASTLLSPIVTIYEAAPDGTTAGIEVSSLTLPAVISSLGLFTGGVVTVTGAFLPGGPNVALVIGGGDGPATPSEIKVQNAVGSGSAGGAIGSAAAPFSFVSLTASGDILLGSAAFDSAAEEIPITTPASEVNPLTPSPDPPLTPAIANRSDHAIFLDVVDLAIAAGGRVLQQNTGGPLAADSGTVIGGDLTLNSYNGAGPKNFDLYATFIDPVVSGPEAAASDRIVVNTPASDPGRPFYRFDGCVIQSSGACATIAGDSAVAIAVATAVDGPFSSSRALPIVAPMQALPVFLLTQPEAADIQDTSVIGATNEEIWRKPDRRKP